MRDEDKAAGTASGKAALIESNSDVRRLLRGNHKDPEFKSLPVTQELLPLKAGRIAG